MFWNVRLQKLEWAAEQPCASITQSLHCFRSFIDDILFLWRFNEWSTTDNSKFIGIGWWSIDWKHYIWLLILGGDLLVHSVWPAESEVNNFCDVACFVFSKWKRSKIHEKKSNRMDFRYFLHSYIMTNRSSSTSCACCSLPRPHNFPYQKAVRLHSTWNKHYRAYIEIHQAFLSHGTSIIRNGQVSPLEKWRQWRNRTQNTDRNRIGNDIHIFSDVFDTKRMLMKYILILSAKVLYLRIGNYALLLLRERERKEDRDREREEKRERDRERNR